MRRGLGGIAPLIRKLLAVATVVAVGTAVGVLTWPDDDSDMVAVPAPSLSVSPSPTTDAGMDSGILAVLTSDNVDGGPVLPLARGASNMRVGLPTAPEVNHEDTTKLNKPSAIATASVSPVKVDKGTLLSMPLNGRQTSQFGMRFHPVLKVWKLHTGLDFSASCGTAVGAVAPGEVISTGWAGGNGIQVKVDHGTIAKHRVVTTYNHLSSVGVTVGQKVDTHQGLGKVGSTGYSTGCHLHLEVIVDGQFTDPLPWLNGDPVIVDTDRLASQVPSPTGSRSPSGSPSPSPSPSASPSASKSPKKPKPSKSPSPKPGTPKPSPSPSPSASSSPSPEPSTSPSPSREPSESPSATESESASQEPSSEPTETETKAETEEPETPESSDESQSVPESTGSPEETD